MVAQNEEFSQLASAVGDFVGAGAISHDVAKIYNCIERRSRGEAGIQSFEIGVNVAEDKYAQKDT